MRVTCKHDSAFRQACDLIAVHAGYGKPVSAPFHHRMCAPGLSQADVQRKPVLAPVWRSLRSATEHRSCELHPIARAERRYARRESRTHHCCQRFGALIVSVPFHAGSCKGHPVETGQVRRCVAIIGTYDFGLAGSIHFDEGCCITFTRAMARKRTPLGVYLGCVIVDNQNPRHSSAAQTRVQVWLIKARKTIVPQPAQV